MVNVEQLFGKMDTMYILHARHADTMRPIHEPMELAWSISRLMTIQECIDFATPKDERFVLHSLWIEVRFPPLSMRK